MDTIELVTMLGAAVSAFSGAYLSAKAQNRAIKEDLSTVLRDVELMKAEVSSGQIRTDYRYQREFQILEELSEKLWMVMSIARELRPAMGVWTHEPQRYEKMMNALEELMTYGNIKRPFVAPFVFEGLVSMHRVIVEVATHFEYLSEAEESHAKKASEHMAGHNAISAASISFMEIIRKRVEEWGGETPNPPGALVRTGTVD